MAKAVSTFSGFVWNKMEHYAADSQFISRKERCIKSLNEDALVAYAAACKGVDCQLLPETTMGGLHLIRLLQFTDGVKWIARIQLDASTKESAARLRSEIGTMDLIREQSTIPIPKVYGYQLFDSNSTGVAFMLIECFSGNAAMDLGGGYEAHRGSIPSERKLDFFRAIAEIQVRPLKVCDC